MSERVTDEHLEAIATEWYFERLEGFTPQRARAFADWSAADARHAAAFARVEHTLALLDALPTVRPRVERALASDRALPAASRTRGRWIPWAAAAMLAIGLAAWSWRAVPPDVVAHVATRAAEERRTQFEDGSVVDLNAATEIEVRYRPDERRVDLHRGEAHFEVAPDPGRPFLVRAHGVTVRAVGTAFSVRLAGERVEVIVTEGRVAVEQEARGESAPRAATLSAPTLVGAGEQATVALNQPARAPTVAPVPAEALEQLRAWQAPVVTFVNAPLREVVARINRRSAAPILIEDPTLADRLMGGSIALDQVDSFLRLLEHSGEMIAERRASGEIVIRRAR